MEQHRWAAPLGSEISRVIAENLAQLLGNRLVSSYEQNTARPDIQVLVDLQRFDSTLGETVTIDALWSIRRSLNGQTKTGRSVIQEPAGGEGYDALVAATAAGCDAELVTCDRRALPVYERYGLRAKLLS